MDLWECRGMSPEHKAHPMIKITLLSILLHGTRHRYSCAILMILRIHAEKVRNNFASTHSSRYGGCPMRSQVACQK